MALIMRILLLLSLSWVIGLTAPLFTVLGQEISGRDLILAGGGLFLLGKSTFEIHENLGGLGVRVRRSLGTSGVRNG
jgi:predicted tellurium resistance membrane protein TerC